MAAKLIGDGKDNRGSDSQALVRAPQRGLVGSSQTGSIGPNQGFFIAPTQKRVPLFARSTVRNLRGSQVEPLAKEGRCKPAKSVLQPGAIVYFSGQPGLQGTFVGVSQQQASPKGVVYQNSSGVSTQVPIEKSLRTPGFDYHLTFPFARTFVSNSFGSPGNHEPSDISSVQSVDLIVRKNSTGEYTVLHYSLGRNEDTVVPPTPGVFHNGGGQGTMVVNIVNNILVNMSGSPPPTPSPSSRTLTAPDPSVQRAPPERGQTIAAEPVRKAAPPPRPQPAEVWYADEGSGTTTYSMPIAQVIAGLDGVLARTGRTKISGNYVVVKSECQNLPTLNSETLMQTTTNTEGKSVVRVRYYHKGTVYNNYLLTEMSRQSTPVPVQMLGKGFAVLIHEMDSSGHFQSGPQVKNPVKVSVALVYKPDGNFYGAFGFISR